MTTFTKEKLINHVRENVKTMKFAVKQTPLKNSLEAIELDLVLPLVAQASLEEEPVAWECGENIILFNPGTIDAYANVRKYHLNHYTPHYFVPVVAAEMYWQDTPVEGSTRAAAYTAGWNDCRASMLKAGKFRENSNSSTNNCREFSETSTNSPVIPD